MALRITLNGQPREFPLPDGAVVADLLQHLELKSDRIAVEQNGTILPRACWGTTSVAPEDRFEVVHFVGGGAPAWDYEVSRRSRSSQRWP